MFSDNVQMFIDDFSENLNKAVDHYQTELLKIRAGRANPKLIERIMVDYYGTPTPLYQMSNISVPDPRMLLITLWDTSALRNVLKAIDEANLGLNPSDDGKVVRLSFPPLTQERRKEIAKDVNKTTENSKITCRNFRREVLDEFKKMKKDNEITEDELDRIEKDVQKILDGIIAKIEMIASNKEKEIMEI
jgi:ribosome recycling factor